MGTAHQPNALKKTPNRALIDIGRPSLLIAPLSSTHDRFTFDCGEPTLDTFLRQFAGQNERRGLGRTYVALAAHTNRVSGYYTVCAGAVAATTVPAKLPQYPVPVVHLARLAVDRRDQGQKIGELLLVDALSRSQRIADQLGIHAVEVRALNDAVRAFYQRYGFQPLLDDPLHLYMTVTAIRKLGLS